MVPGTCLGAWQDPAALAEQSHYVVLNKLLCGKSMDGVFRQSCLVAERDAMQKKQVVVSHGPISCDRSGWHNLSILPHGRDIER